MLLHSGVEGMSSEMLRAMIFVSSKVALRTEKMFFNVFDKVHGDLKHLFTIRVSSA